MYTFKKEGEFILVFGKDKSRTAARYYIGDGTITNEEAMNRKDINLLFDMIDKFIQNDFQ